MGILWTNGMLDCQSAAPPICGFDSVPGSPTGLLARYLLLVSHTGGPSISKQLLPIFFILQCDHKGIPWGFRLIAIDPSADRRGSAGRRPRIRTHDDLPPAGLPAPVIQ
ncbi:hypothetical protein VTJ04DRAFT_4279 [Mycothermus thermophilus]|uniref:uncharacterized protein n=1 Tax=Humicola insolens TaxID=85995 RepID=UPI003743340D